MKKNHNTLDNQNDNDDVAESKQVQQDAAENEETKRDKLFETNWEKVVESFDHMKLSECLLRGIYAYGWEKPSGIQQRAIMPVIEGRDTIAQAQSGTGKTGTFSIASLQRIDVEVAECQVLILSPVRELARQTFSVISALGSKFKTLSIYMCIGGTSVRDDIAALSKGQQIVVGTPGRVNSMIQKGVLSLKALRLFVLDEADEMLSCGFKEQIYECFQYLPQDVQVALFSATMPVEVLSLTQRFMRNPVRILVKDNELTLDGIKQWYVAVEREEYKLATLFDLYQSLTIVQAMIFVNSRRKVQWLRDKMVQNDFTVSCIHGELSAQEREFVMKEFRSGTSRVLISTDLLSRGIDVNTVSLVINYDLPKFKESYIHRIGRSGRYGKKGCAVNFVPDDEGQKLRDIERFYDTVINELPAELEQVM
jgi:translation initiation factor 4A